mmetsp:Transcript_88971/g.177912  ORF Transcript_88971/g.177912 Transcript_88971/m.177912 type:complete len:217 (+) Transcript_88971:374-1024(+)
MGGHSLWGRNRATCSTAITTSTAFLALCIFLGLLLLQPQRDLPSFLLTHWSLDPALNEATLCGWRVRVPAVPSFCGSVKLEPLLHQSAQQRNHVRLPAGPHLGPATEQKEASGRGEEQLSECTGPCGGRRPIIASTIAAACTVPTSTVSFLVLLLLLLLPRCFIRKRVRTSKNRSSHLRKTRSVHRQICASLQWWAYEAVESAQNKNPHHLQHVPR